MVGHMSGKSHTCYMVILLVLLKFYHFVLRMQLKRKLHSYAVLPYACSLQKKNINESLKAEKKILISKTGKE